MKYDDARWHYAGDFPADQPQEQGGTHIALFLKWCFVKGWAGDLHIQEEPQDVSNVISGKLSATEFYTMAETTGSVSTKRTESVNSWKSTKQCPTQ
ncbi:hypothetical protein POF45_02860 [Pseudomonas sp. 681]|uniref:DUF7832 domain-containing protein n=1 Tax=Pseudomonas fungipugnans TaxID=3024217 RepID=A0ABT6QHM3_9PSED|nr:hypothetical protein [Pseudomonas sp. 681]MDI2590371.1 hypothetical protein [Pseudomonas sp. 681]